MFESSIRVTIFTSIWTRYMGKVISIKNANKLSEESNGKSDIHTQLVLDILQRGEKPTKGQIVQYLQQHNIVSHSVDDLRTDLSDVFPAELSHDDIQLLANMYEDIGTHNLNHLEFSINFDNTHEPLLDHSLDAITSLLDRQTVSQLTLWTQQDLLQNLHQYPLNKKAPQIHPLNSHFTRKKWSSDQSARKAA